MSYGAVLYFDLDGTLIDPTEGIAAAVATAFAELGAPAPTGEQLRACVGPPLRESLGKLLGPSRRGVTERAVELFRRSYGDTGLMRCSRM